MEKLIQAMGKREPAQGIGSRHPRLIEWEIWNISEDSLKRWQRRTDGGQQRPKYTMREALKETAQDCGQADETEDIFGTLGEKEAREATSRLTSFRKDHKMSLAKHHRSQMTG